MIYIHSCVFFPLSNDTKMKIIDFLVAEIIGKRTPPSVYQCMEIKNVFARKHSIIFIFISFARGKNIHEGIYIYISFWFVCFYIGEKHPQILQNSCSEKCQQSHVCGEVRGQGRLILHQVVNTCFQNISTPSALWIPPVLTL